MTQPLAEQISMELTRTMKSKLKFKLFLCCKRHNKQHRLIRQANKRFNTFCDVESLINVSLSLNLLLHALMSPAQASLFMNQRQRAIKLNMAKSSSDTDSGIANDEFSHTKQFKHDIKRLLVGFSTTTEFDRRLLQGVLGKAPS